MSGFFDRMLGRNNENKGSSENAKARLKFVLEHDRINISPEKLREMKTRIIAVIAEYVSDVDPDTVDILLEQSDRYNNKIVAEIPFTKPRATPAEDHDGNDDLVTSDAEFQFEDDNHLQETAKNEALILEPDEQDNTNDVEPEIASTSDKDD